MADNPLMIGTKLALGLVVHLLPAPHRVVDSQLFVQGRLLLWPRWSTLDREDQNRVCRLLGLRPESLTNQRVFFDKAFAILDERAEFEPIAELSDSPDAADELYADCWRQPFRMVAGRPIVERIDGWIERLERGSQTRIRSTKPRGDGPTLDLQTGNRSYSIPVSHLAGGDTLVPTLETNPEVPTLELCPETLRRLAQSIDAKARSGPSYEAVAVDAFARQLATEAGAPVRTLTAGPTQLAMAPTGTGKSVFTRLAALHFAAHGHPVALVVPGVSSVWHESIRLEAAIKAAGLPLTVAPLSSSAKIGPRLQQHLEHSSADDPHGGWALRRVGYVCNLGPYLNRPQRPPALGDEPCKQLRLLDGGSRTRVDCPFAAGCGRFAPFERAMSADIIVINHAALTMGRVPIPVSVDGGRARLISMAELVLRRCPVVFIDEIDRLQSSMIESLSGGLMLGSRGQLSLPYQLLVEVEQRRASQVLGAELRFERGRSALMRICHEAERLAELINRRELEWPAKTQAIWRDGLDAAIAGDLFGANDNGIAEVRKLYDRGHVFDNPRHEAIRLVLSQLAGPGLGDGRRYSEDRAHLMTALDDWHPPRGDSQAARSRLVDRLVVRASLLQLDLAIRHLGPQLPGLESEDIIEAGHMRERLLGYAPWSPSPLGALGQRLFGYSFAGASDAPGVLETRTFAGDPHGVVADFGDIVAQALCAAKRIVVGFSATCRFPGSPRSDVLSPLLGFVPDHDRNVQIASAPVSIRVSGTVRNRYGAARAAARELFDTTVGNYMKQLVATPESAGRARALLVTNSYKEAQAATEGLIEASRDAHNDIAILRVARANSEANSSTVLSPSRLSDFGSIVGPAILVSPLSVVARGHNILQPGTSRSAISGIFVLTRPVPPTHQPESYLAHVSYHARRRPTIWRGDVGETLRTERRQAWARIRTLQKSSPVFGQMQLEIRRELVCDVLVELAQLAGRARRGGTPVDLYFVDAAFEDTLAPWGELVADILQWWHNQGCLPTMRSMHGAFVHALATYAGFPLEAM